MTEPNKLAFLQLLADAAGQSLEDFTAAKDAAYFAKVQAAVDDAVALTAETYMHQLNEDRDQMLAKLTRFKDLTETIASDNANMRVRMRGFETRLGDVEVVLSDHLEES